MESKLLPVVLRDSQGLSSSQHEILHQISDGGARHAGGTMWLAR